MYVRALPTTDVNRNTEWFTYPGVWTTYILILFFSWLLVLSVFHCSPGMAWTIVHLAHFTVHFFSFNLEICLSLSLFRLDSLDSMNRVISLLNSKKKVTYHSFHWKKGTPFGDDQGIYNRLTWWEQIDNGKQLTRNRKFLTVVPIVL